MLQLFPVVCHGHLLMFCLCVVNWNVTLGELFLVPTSMNSVCQQFGQLLWPLTFRVSQEWGWTTSAVNSIYDVQMQPTGLDVLYSHYTVPIMWLAHTCITCIHIHRKYSSDVHICTHIKSRFHMHLWLDFNLLVESHVLLAYSCTLHTGSTICDQLLHNLMVSREK